MGQGIKCIPTNTFVKFEPRRYVGLPWPEMVEMDEKCDF